MLLRPIGNGSGWWNAASRLFPRRAATEIPWEKVAGIGNVLRHNYESIAAPVIWKLVQADLPLLKKVCREELATELSGNSAVDRGRAPKLNQSRRKLSMQDSSGLILSMPRSSIARHHNRNRSPAQLAEPGRSHHRPRTLLFASGQSAQLPTRPA